MNIKPNTSGKRSLLSPTSPLPPFPGLSGTIRPSEKVLNIALNYSLSHIQQNAGIPAGTMARIIRGEFKPSASTVQRLSNMVRRSEQAARYRYAREKGLTSREARSVRGMSTSRARKYVDMRKVGATVDTAKLATYLPSEKLKSYRQRYRDVARTLAKQHGVKMKHIFRGMSFSDRNLDQWEKYIRAKGYK